MLAMTADGKIAKTEGHLADWTSPEDKKSFIAETKKAGLIIMGRSTYETIGRPLPGRLNLILTSSPDRFKDKEKKGLLEFTKGTPAEIAEQLEERGFKEAILGGGGKTNQDFIKAGMVDELLLTIEPKLFGQGVGLFSDSLDINLKLLELNKLNENSIQIRYAVIK